MKTLIVMACSALLMAGYGFTTLESTPKTLPNLNGMWNLSVDSNLDGNISGNNGCSEMRFSQSGNKFTAKYTKCGPQSQNALPARFTGQIYETNRGVLIHMLLDNQNSTQYYGSWGGTVIDGEVIEGLATDLEGNRFEFRLTR